MRRSHRGERILVVDDERFIRELLTDVLTHTGYEVRAARHGGEGLRLLDGWAPDLILLDLNMPEVDGWAFRARQLALEHLAQVPVVLLSATADVTLVVRQLAPAAALSKPFELDRLLEIIRVLLADSTAAARSRLDQARAS